MKKMTLMMVAAIGVGFAGCAHKKEMAESKDAAAPSAMSKPAVDAMSAAAAADKPTFVTELTFEKGSTTLSDAQKKNLSALLSRAQASGKIDDVKVVTWSDMEYPSPNVQKLSKAQRDLATRRSRAVKDYLKSVEKGLDVDAYNMAERPNAFERLVRTPDERIKRSLEVAGIPTTDSYIKVPAKASKSIVMLVME